MKHPKPLLFNIIISALLLSGCATTGATPESGDASADTGSAQSSEPAAPAAPAAEPECD